jgi:hypothetical protein
VRQDETHGQHDGEILVVHRHEDAPKGLPKQ